MMFENLRFDIHVMDWHVYPISHPATPQDRTLDEDGMMVLLSNIQHATLGITPRKAGEVEAVSKLADTLLESMLSGGKIQLHRLVLECRFPEPGACDRIANMLAFRLKDHGGIRVGLYCISNDYKAVVSAECYERMVQEIGGEHVLEAWGDWF